MPAISLVVCLHREQALLERLLLNSNDCYDDLVVVHDGAEEMESSNSAIQQGALPLDFDDEASRATWCRAYVSKRSPGPDKGIASLVERYGGRFFEGPRCFQQEPHWPFAWAQAKHDWILRLDADEFPSPELQSWLRDFRRRQDPGEAISGYTCFWPLWNGRRTMTRRWPGGRIFMFHRKRVRFVGMVEEIPLAEQVYKPLNLILCHRPPRKTYGIRNIVTRKQAYHWRRVIAESLMKPATELPRWRWKSADWPANWENIRRAPIRHALTSLYRLPRAQLKGMLLDDEVPNVSACLNPALHHFLLGLRVAIEKHRQRTSFC